MLRFVVAHSPVDLSTGWESSDSLSDLLLLHSNIKRHFWHFPSAAACKKWTVCHKALISIKREAQLHL